MDTEPTATDWAYLAGLIDGEGSIHLVQRKPGTVWTAARGKYRYIRPVNSFQCIVTISNTDWKMVDWTASTFGGGTSFSRRREGNRKIQYTVHWQANDEVVRILLGVKPYLLTKYELAEVVLRFLSVPKWEKEVREIIHSEFKQLRESIRVTGKEQLNA